MYSEKITSLKLLDKAAANLINHFPDQRVFAFYGKMGAGKTTFIQSICKYLGSGDNITSPSFALVNEYQTVHGDSVYHLDFYRIKNIEEVFDLGYEDYFYSGKYCLIEWPEKIEPLLPDEYVKTKIKVGPKMERLISAQILKIAL
jgi:tRNA threonylcarbamoyladenosine biosynthesis protein TsaE